MIPSDKAVQDALGRAHKYWRATHQNMRDEDTLYRNARKLDYLPKNIPGLRSITAPIAWGVVSRAQQNVPLSAITHEGIPKPGQRGGEPTADSIRLAEKVGPWLRAAHDDDTNRAFRARPTPQQPPLLKAITLEFLRGMVYLKTIEDVSGYEPIKARRESKKEFDLRYRRWEADHHFPFPMYAVDPLLVFADPAGEIVFEESKQYGSAIRNLFESQGWPTDGFKNDDELLTFRECWTDEYCLYYLADSLIQSRKHNYGFNPFIPVYSGLGSLTEITGSGDDGPQNLAISLFHFLTAMIDEVDYTTTEMGQQRRTNTYPWSFGPSTGTQEGPKPGEYLVLQQGEQPPGYVNPPNQLRDLSAYAAGLKAEIDQMTAPAVLGGATPPRQTTATEYLGSVATARLVVGNPMDALAAGLEISNEYRLRLLEMSSDKTDRVVVGTRYERQGLEGDFKGRVQQSSLSGSQLNGWYKNKVLIEPTNPQEEALAINNARVLYNDGNGVISKAEYAHRAKVKDYGAQLVRREAEKYLESPAVAQALSERLAFQWKMEQATKIAQGEPGEAEKVMGDMESMMQDTPSGMNIPPQMEAQVPGSAAGAAQLIGQAGV